MDSAWEHNKLKDRKMLENAAESHTSPARFVSCHWLDTRVVNPSRQFMITSYAMYGVHRLKVWLRFKVTDSTVS